MRLLITIILLKLSAFVMPALAQDNVVFTAGLSNFSYNSDNGSKWKQNSAEGDFEDVFTVSNGCGSVEAALSVIQATQTIPPIVKYQKSLGEWCYTPINWSERDYLIMGKVEEGMLVGVDFVLPIEYSSSKFFLSEEFLETLDEDITSQLPIRIEMREESECLSETVTCKLTQSVIYAEELFAL